VNIPRSAVVWFVKRGAVGPPTSWQPAASRAAAASTRRRGEEGQVGRRRRRHRTEGSSEAIRSGGHQRAEDSSHRDQPGPWRTTSERGRARPSLRAGDGPSGQIPDDVAPRSPRRARRNPLLAGASAACCWELPERPQPCGAPDPPPRSRRSRYGSGRSSTTLTMLNMAVFAPMPNARRSVTVAANPATPPEVAGGMAQVPPQVVQPAPTPHVAGAFANQRHVAQAPVRRPLGFVLRGAGLALPLALQLQVQVESAFLTMSASA